METNKVESYAKCHVTDLVETNQGRIGILSGSCTLQLLAQPAPGFEIPKSEKKRKKNQRTRAQASNSLRLDKHSYITAKISRQAYDAAQVKTHYRVAEMKLIDIPSLHPSRPEKLSAFDLEDRARSK